MTRFAMPQNHSQPPREPEPDVLPLPVEPDRGPVPDALPGQPQRDGVPVPVAHQERQLAANQSVFAP